MRSFKNIQCFSESGEASVLTPEILEVFQWLRSSFTSGVRQQTAFIKGLLFLVLGCVTLSMTMPNKAWSEPLNNDNGHISELKFGLLRHDVGAISTKREQGEDFNLEIMFRTPRIRFFQKIWSPRPIVGILINNSGYTSQLYSGLDWQLNFATRFFIDFSFGFSIHTGGVSTMESGRKAMGSRVLFREALEFGVRLKGPHSLSLMIDHVSNAYLGTTNPGMENFGVRYGYRFK